MNKTSKNKAAADPKIYETENDISQNHREELNERLAGASSDSKAPPAPAGMDFAPSPEEVAREAYFAYVNEGSPEGRDVQHWLDAEARLTKARERTRKHDFHNRT